MRKVRPACGGARAERVGSAAKVHQCSPLHHLCSKRWYKADDSLWRMSQDWVFKGCSVYKGKRIIVHIIFPQRLFFFLQCSSRKLLFTEGGNSGWQSPAQESQIQRSHHILKGACAAIILPFKTRSHTVLQDAAQHSKVKRGIPRQTSAQTTSVQDCRRPGAEGGGVYPGFSRGFTKSQHSGATWWLESGQPNVII